MSATVIFVYNADAGFINGIFDFFHKMMKPSTYHCDLCMITHNHIGMRKAWKAYLDSLPFEKDYLHRNQFFAQFGIKEGLELPAVFLQKGDDIECIIKADELKSVDLVGLTDLLKGRLISCKLASKAQ